MADTKRVLFLVGCLFVVLALGVIAFSGGIISFGKAIASYEEILLSSREIQQLAMRLPFFDELPEDAVLVFSFYDGNGEMRAGADYTLYGNGTVRRFLPQTYDVRLITGDYNFVMLKETADLCAGLRKIGNNKDFRIERGKSVPALLLKYRAF